MRVIADEGKSFRTAPCRVKLLAGTSCSPVWDESERCLRINRGVTRLRIHVVARVAQSQGNESAFGRPACGAEVAGGDPDVVLAVASVRLIATCDGLNNVELFPPGRRDFVDGDSSSNAEEESATNRRVKEAEPPNSVGHLALRLRWLAFGEEDGDQVVLFIHGASGLAQVDLWVYFPQRRIGASATVVSLPLPSYS